MKKINRFLTLGLLTLSLFSCSERPINEGIWIKYTSTSLKIANKDNINIEPFNTVMSINYFKNSKYSFNEDFDSKLESVFLDNIETLHKQFDRHYYYLDDDNNLITSIKTINDSYGTGEEVYCSEELYGLVKLGVEYSELTKGYYNFFAGGLVEFWDEIISEVSDGVEVDRLKQIDPYYSKEQKEIMENYSLSMPTLEEINQLITFNDEKKSIIFNSIDDFIKEDGTILSRSQKNSKYRPSITSGGIAKGYATDLLKINLTKEGYTEGWLNSGSSSITLLSKPSFEEYGYQNIGIADPKTSSFFRKAALTLKLYEESSISTSGNYTIGKSYYLNVEGGRIYRHHIVNPFTGDCPQYHNSVTLYSKTFSNGELDALSTAFVSLSVEEGLKYREELLKQKQGYDLEIIYMDDLPTNADKLQITTTSDFNKSLEIVSEGSKVIYA